MSEPTTGNWRIIPVIGSGVTSTVGIGGPGGPSQPVRLNEPISVWRFTQQAGLLVFRFAITDIYGYTGVEEIIDTGGGRTIVIVTQDVSRDLRWTLISRGDNLYTISPDNNLGVGWTVLPELNEIGITPIDPDNISPSQLFKFARVD